MLLKSLALNYTKQENLRKKKKKKQTMRQAADSPERGKATNRKKEPREKCSKTKDTRQEIRKQKYKKLRFVIGTSL
jgi:hypothetical protein